MKRKTIQLGAITRGGVCCQILGSVSRCGVVHSARLAFQDGSKRSYRKNDRTWFVKHLGTFMKDKEIHHEWENGAVCYVLSKKEHDKVHGRRC